MRAMQPVGPLVRCICIGRCKKRWTRSVVCDGKGSGTYGTVSVGETITEGINRGRHSGMQHDVPGA